MTFCPSAGVDSAVPHPRHSIALLAVANEHSGHHGPSSLRSISNRGRPVEGGYGLFWIVTVLKSRWVCRNDRARGTEPKRAANHTFRDIANSRWSSAHQALLRPRLDVAIAHSRPGVQSPVKQARTCRDLLSRRLGAVATASDAEIERPVLGPCRWTRSFGSSEASFCLLRK